MPHPGGSYVWQTKDFKSNDFGCVASKGVMGEFRGCVATKRLSDSRPVIRLDLVARGSKVAERREGEAAVDSGIWRQLWLTNTTHVKHGHYTSQ